MRAKPAHFPPGLAEIEVEQVCQASALTTAFATAPLKLLTPRSRGPGVWAYLSSLGGGLVAGDQTRLNVRVGPGARCFLSSQSATKVYRNAARRPCGHVTTAVVEAGALLALMPAPVQPFAGSTYSQEQTFSLAAGASLALSDLFTAGRPARGERWAFDRFSSRNRVFEETCLSPVAPPDAQGKHPAPVALFLDAVDLDGRRPSMRSAFSTGRMNCFALLLLLGPLLRDAAAALLDWAGGSPILRRASLLASASPLRDGAVLRLAGEHVEAVEAELHARLTGLEALLGGLPWARRL